VPRNVMAVLIVMVAASALGRTQRPPTLTADAGRSIVDHRGGGGRAYTIDSAILKETRKIDIALPASHARSAMGRRYPVTVLLDGEASLPAAAAVADELTRNGQIPESIIVAIENSNRLRDLTPPGVSVSGSSLHEGGDRFLDFIELELLPAVDRQVRGSAPRVLVGHSSGGILATYAAATRPAFRCVVALDAPTHHGENWLARKLIDRAKGAGAPLRYVSYEARYGWADDTWRALLAAAPPSWTLHREKLEMESHESVPMLGMYLGLRQVFRDYSMLAAPEAPTTSVLPYYAEVGRALGAEVVPPGPLLNRVVEDLLMEGRGAAARAAYDTLVAGYGAPSNGSSLVEEIAEVERRPPPTETVESLLATPFPTPEEARPYVGEWVGDVWSSEGELHAGRPVSTVRIAIVDGRVVGESESRPAPGVTLVQKWTYFKVTPSGFTFGFMNGMRPRGMLMHEGTVTGGTLTGVMRFGGINFTYPAGMTPPTIRFRYEKVR
jgi:hypothetical protein